MTLRRQVTFWAVALAVVILALWLLGDIMLPFIAGLVLAYFLDPVADALERLGMPRLAATLFILISSIVVIVVLLLLLLPVLGDQIARFSSNLPGYVLALVKLFDELAPLWLKEMLASSGTNLPASLSDLAGKAAGWIGAILTSILSGSLALVNVLSLLVVTPIVAFYMLNDWDRMVEKVDGWLPREHLETIRALARQMDEAMAGFIRGQGTVCLLLGVFYAVALSFAGLNFGLLIGLGAGLLSFIPYVGSIVGGVLAIGMALIQFWPDWVSIIMIVAIFAFGQFVEGNFLSPNLVGNRIGLHPVWLMFALFAFGYFFGFVGLLLAVPLAAAAGVLVRFALQQYLKSSYYLGVPTRENPAGPNLAEPKRRGPSK
ncbi:AI-2E family transporter [Nordella sp. HKS 07]|uniref:AI-2E family transporter n=1 Tax=Nordella sp. HKS 07 TaxID=2712222 RepID=UPI0013E0FBEF|nr:AI-2E family transporter [Nordella sp. HKS 07]QIG50722.1 AI-2E family transporter [Nordella sp. HKS 07]